MKLSLIELRKIIRKIIKESAEDSSVPYADEILRLFEPGYEDFMQAANLLEGLDVFNDTPLKTAIKNKIKELEIFKDCFEKNVFNIQKISNKDIIDSLFKICIHTGLIEENVKELDLSHLIQLTDLSPISYLQNLTKLNLSGCSKKIQENISPLNSLNNLIVLDLQENVYLKDISSLASLHNLKDLNLSSCTELIDISPLKNLQSLTKLNLSGCEKLENIKSLQNLKNLEILKLKDCKVLRDISPIISLHKLTHLDLTGTKITNKQKQTVQENLPNLNIFKSDGRVVNPAKRQNSN